MKINLSPTHKGFSLLELLVVLSIITILAGTVLVSVDGNGDQVRYDVTKQQYDSIRIAIIGNNSVSQTGSISVNGYIADTGSRPTKVSSLFINPDTNNVTSGTYPDDEFRSDRKLWRDVGAEVSATDWNDGAAPSGLRLKHGWRGPYLNGDYVIDSLDSSVAHFFDSWGNDWDANYDDDTASGIPEPGNISFFSNSKDQVVGNSDSDEYSKDYPSHAAQKVISNELFQVDLSSVLLPSLRIQNDSGDVLMVGLIYPGIDLSSTMNDAVTGWHESLVEYDSINPIEIPVSAVNSPSILNQNPALTGSFGGHPEAYRYQIALYVKSTNTTATLSKQIVRVLDDVFIFAPTHSSTTPSVSNINWEISAP